MSFFSIIMPSYLGHYSGAAKNRKGKFTRAVNSLLEQTFEDWELVVVSDGCRDTPAELSKFHDPRIRLIEIPKEPLWSPEPRNRGIEAATGLWIHYLDTDDCYGPDHLKIIFEGLQATPPEYGWAFFNDWYFLHGRKEWVERKCDPNVKYKHGTSNIIHARSLGAYWPKGGYQHDLHFVDLLKRQGPPMVLPTPQYYVCHYPPNYDV